jgi:DNA-binding transcriptional MocR family regulator
MREGVEVPTLSRLAFGAPRVMKRGALLLGYAAFDRREIREGVRGLLRALGGMASSATRINDRRPPRVPSP